MTVIGVAPEGFYGDRMSSTPPDFYLPIATVPNEMGGKGFRDPSQNWLDVIGRVKPGVALVPLQEKLSAELKRIYAKIHTFQQRISQRHIWFSLPAVPAHSLCRIVMHPTSNF